VANRTLIKIIHTDTEQVELFAIPSSMLSIEEMAEPNIVFGYGNYPISLPPSRIRGEIKINCVMNPDIITLFTESLAMSRFKIRVYLDIDSFDPDDFEMALNVRAVHKSPYPDFANDHCVMSKISFETQYNCVYDKSDLIYQFIVKF